MREISYKKLMLKNGLVHAKFYEHRFNFIFSILACDEGWKLAG